MYAVGFKKLTLRTRAMDIKVTVTKISMCVLTHECVVAREWKGQFQKASLIKDVWLNQPDTSTPQKGVLGIYSIHGNVVLILQH